MPQPALKADCARCAGLCCVAPPFDPSPEFGHAKPANTPCQHLCADNRCAIHARRLEEGYAGCISYDCHGAGQAVTQDMFGGRSWRDDASLMAPMSRAFLAMRQVHDLLVLLDRAGQMPLTTDERVTLEALRGDLVPAAGWTLGALEAVVSKGEVSARVHTYLTTLAHHFRLAR
ncbi:hypothetical protein [Hyphomonas pacifica]|uniref:Pentapeptide repeat-containing protein n=1 Tax=Hyphomonas pacifica TaxID=1280941 RepID=A0A062TQK8_9PROT|nr:hypothetical protein [Hyphomonas pacifica]KCZ49424.1 hypothetical protein HY2_03285 [Hyphomonas pacifica]RAN32959.1 hypothetical protein HY11_04515 [Hyphomonas pacifica]RAN33230.1 hypothetical protein HY3_02450 [Hyphomonas pacifica]